MTANMMAAPARPADHIAGSSKPQLMDVASGTFTHTCGMRGEGLDSSKGMQAPTLTWACQPIQPAYHKHLAAHGSPGCGTCGSS